jgi:hypothetical protein
MVVLWRDGVGSSVVVEVVRLVVAHSDGKAGNCLLLGRERGYDRSLHLLSRESGKVVLELVGLVALDGELMGEGMKDQKRRLGTTIFITLDFSCEKKE